MIKIYEELEHSVRTNVNLYSFGEFDIGYEHIGLQHRMFVRRNQGDWQVSEWQHISLPLTFEGYDGSQFVCQKLTSRLPTCFKIIPADGNRLVLI